MNEFSWVFLVALGLVSATEWWLNRRQRRNVAAHRDRCPIEFSESIGPQAHRKAADYTVAGLALDQWRIAWSVILLLAWTFGGGLNALAGLIAQTGWSDWAQGTALFISFGLIGAALALPFDVISTFGIEARFGFNRTSAKRFILDLLLQTVVGLALGVPLAAAIIWVLYEYPQGWWLLAWAIWLGFSLLMMWLYPSLIAPLFNKFTPLQDEKLKARVDALLARCGFKSQGLFVTNGSIRSSHGNAYFTGFGDNKRIVFYDTLLETLENEEVEAVLAHELGHYRKKHIRRRLIIMAVIGLGALWLANWCIGQPAFFAGLGVAGHEPATGLLLVLLVSPVAGFILTPLITWLSRRDEFEADAFAAEHAPTDRLISALVKLYRDNASTLTPDALYSQFHHSHPPPQERIAALHNLGMRPITGDR